VLLEVGDHRGAPGRVHGGVDHLAAGYHGLWAAQEGIQGGFVPDQVRFAQGGGIVIAGRTGGLAAELRRTGSADLVDAPRAAGMAVGADLEGQALGALCRVLCRVLPDAGSEGAGYQQQAGYRACRAQMRHGGSSILGKQGGSLGQAAWCTIVVPASRQSQRWP
jgi:hypothetical protein